jgi:predicted enzyme related to lactoylglutathione lyase
MWFVLCPSRKAGKIRIHLEVTVDDVEGAIDLVAGLAGRTTGERHDNDKGAVAVMTDPDGLEFSLVQYYSEASVLAAIRVNMLDE